MSGHRTIFALALALSLGACDDDPDGGPKAEPLPEYTAGHWAVAKRGVALDAEDLQIFGSGIDPARIGADFGLLVLNRPYHDRRTGCPSVMEAAVHQPRATVEAFINGPLARAGVSFDRIAVNVDLLNPGRGALLHVCNSEQIQRFDLNAHRDAVKAAFEDLARLPRISAITVGLEMNRYYHLTLDDERRLDDYSNWVTLYREIYAAIKAINPEIKVGPGIHWGTFMRLTVPEVAAEAGLIEPGAQVPAALLSEAVTLAARRTIWPLLLPRISAETGLDGPRSADFLAVSMVPRQQDPPFRSAPEGQDEAEVLRHYRPLPDVALGLPIVLPQIDWETQSGANANAKASYLTILKRAVSHANVEWAAWRRLVDIPEIQGGPINPCAAFSGSSPSLDQRSLYHPVDYCYSGMINDRGQVRGVYNIFTTNP